MEAVDVDFDAESTQVFRIGAGLGAPCPGAVAGLAEAHRALRRRCPWARADRAGDRARPRRRRADPAAGVPARDPRPDPPPHRRGPRDLRRRRGQARRRRRARACPTSPRRSSCSPSAAPTPLRRRARPCASSRTCASTAAASRPRTSRATASSARRPIRVPYRGHEFVSNPPPSSGGILIGYGLALLERLGAGGPPGSAEAIARLVEVMREQTRARGGGFVARALPRRRSRGGCTTRRRSRRPRRGSRRGCRARRAAPRAGRRTSRSSTPQGNAASLTFSTGSGSGVIVPGTGIHLNNMLGEYDLAPSERGRARARG